MRTKMFFAGLLMFSLAFANPNQHQIIRVYPVTDSQILKLITLNLDIASVKMNDYVEIVASGDDLAKLDAAGISYTIEIENWEQHYAEVVNPNQDLMGGFLTFTEMIDRMNEIHDLYPDFTTAPYSIGQSWEGREMWVIKVSDNPEMDENEPEVWYDGLHHAREPIGMQLIIYFIEYLMENYGTIPEVTEAVDERELFFLPCANPDGYAYNEQTNPNGGGMWRKNRRDNGGSYGVDLNRNYPYYWGYDDNGSSPSPSSTTYRGPSPGSEPETQAIMAYINTRHIALSHSFHSYGDMILYPWGGDYLGFTPDHADFEMMANQMSSYNGYDPGTPWQLLYNVNGGSFDWHYGETNEHYKIMAFSEEVGPSFWPTPSSIPQLCQENVAVNLYSALVAEDYTPPEISLSYIGLEIDDSMGNNNGTAEPGETVGVSMTVRNNGFGDAAGIDAVLETDDMNFNITTSISSYLSIPSLTNAQNSPPFTVVVDENCPDLYNAEFRLILTQAGGLTDTFRIAFQVGDPLNSPSGPDNYGYMAYDQNDGHEYGAYEWIETDPQFGGSGDEVVFSSDDQTLQRDLPFNFSYYGTDFSSISICSNGWIAMGYTTNNDYSNSEIPDSDGPAAMVAPFWEDLSPQIEGGVFTYYDETNHWYVVEFSRVRQFSPTTAFETFEVIFFDPAEYPTITGDGLIKFQYHTVTDDISCTVGIENLNETDGIQILYNTCYHFNSHPVEAESAIIFTTIGNLPEMTVALIPVNPPIVIPAGGGAFEYSLSIANTGQITAVFDAWIQAELPSGNIYEILVRTGVMLNPGASISRNMTQNIPGGAPVGDYTYALLTGNHPDLVYAEASFPFSKSGTDGTASGNWDLYGWDGPADLSDVLPVSFELKQNYPNPFNPETAIQFALPEASKVSLKIFNITGQTVETLAEGYLDAGYHSVVWNAESLPSGVYFYSLETGGFSAVKKCVLVK